MRRRFGVIVAGGGIAGFEALLRLRRLGGDRLDITLISPAGRLVYRPSAVLAPFQRGYPRWYPVRDLVADIGVRWVHDRLAWVDRHARVVHSSEGHALGYDALLLAVGGRRIPPTDGAFAFSDDTVSGYRPILDHAVAGDIRGLLFAVPNGPGWPLPLYELALLTAAHIRNAGMVADLAVTTPGSRPLDVFGSEAGEAIGALLDQARIALYTGTTAHLAGARDVLLRPSGRLLHPDRLITQPRISGPNVRGIPGAGAERFLPVDPYCRVIGTDGRVFAAGDATHFAVKQGGLGTQQADTAAAGIAHLAGILSAPSPLRATISGVLLTADGPRHLAAHLVAGRIWRAALTTSAPWPAEEKIVARELSPYLTAWDARKTMAIVPS